MRVGSRGGLALAAWDSDALPAKFRLQQSADAVLGTGPTLVRASENCKGNCPAMPV
ncbi:hypothetical protein XFF6166_550057 [Xanthomonas citri pv. fuscans]|uniref:Uncharacterized protein n=2 Tax=Xanthomonas TaxID=338 RepID=A0A2H1PQC9_XANCH|nr:hypothetical protein XAC9322_320053 [Xanthomonas citri pv. citri]CEJ43156.1 hypothetical protein XAB3213_1840008 [Xanthomonas citri pv. bilvae]SON77115.1 hypothetical protein XAP6984_1280062 [Xanthomonas phaseoli pv. phaseoli]SON82610.1 hypothetical protein XFF6166_550057 [Xanthomonas citri pv. fuscans]CEE24185.1 hypothetical protein XAC3824_360054 [Xanthomonas citri pv. citri]